MQYRLYNINRTFELDQEKVKTKLGKKRMEKVEEITLESDVVFIYLHEQYKDSLLASCGGFEPSDSHSQKEFFDVIKDWIDSTTDTTA